MSNWQPIILIGGGMLLMVAIVVADIWVTIRFWKRFNVNDENDHE